MAHSTEPQSSGKHPDRAVSAPEEDLYGFTYIATELARAIQGIGREGSAVVGIEGAWGTGKTSLLNLLRTALDEQKEERTYVLSISPWLDGSDTPLVASLLLPVAGIIAQEEEKRLSSRELKTLRKKKRVTDTAQTLMDYTRATARTLAPVAQAATVIPGVPDASGALKALSDSNWLKEKEQTTAEMRTHIAAKINELDLSFIVLLDDLDRLEPAQAVEVIRLVKSVADFPRFRYLLCYDKAVLSQAISQGLGVADGSLYLQKIVQISFGLPRPETFVLRREFRDKAIELYQTVNGHSPDSNLQNDLTRVADIYGAMLKTPREVRIVLNALEFRYAGMRDYVYFPDLCFLQLLRTTNAGLYDWVEEYLAERAIVETGDGSVSTDEQKVLTESLKAHLAVYYPARAHTINPLEEHVPGISDALGNLPVSLFGPTGDHEKARLTAGKRLGSQAYWRYYFAFAAPQNVLPPAIFDRIFSLAGHPGMQQELAEYLLGFIQSKNLSSQTWFEHILTQMTVPLIEARTPEEYAGLIRFFFNYGDQVIERYRAGNDWFYLYDLDTYSVVDRLINRMFRSAGSEKSMALLSDLLSNGQAWYWIAEYVRHLLWQHGIAGTRSQRELEEWMDLEQLGQLRDRLSKRLNSPEITEQLPDFPLLNSYIWAWRDISGAGVIREWADRLVAKDLAFLKLLLLLRHQGSSSVDGLYKALKLDNMNEFLGDINAVKERVERIREAGSFPELVAEVEQSIERNRF